MKILDPQSALLTNAEVHQFLLSNPPRPLEKPIGAYPITNLTGYAAVRRDFKAYTSEITPFVARTENVEGWIGELVKRLEGGGYGLAKTEVLNLVNMGVGVRGVEGKVEGDGEEEEDDGGEAEMARDVQFFKVAVEEVEERFEAEGGEERVREVVGIFKECVRMKGGGEVKGKDGVEEAEAEVNGVNSEDDDGDEEVDEADG